MTYGDLAKHKTFRSKKYLAFVRGLPCVICYSADRVVAHHESFLDDRGGTSLKSSDSLTMPLCFECHGAVHLGEDTFYIVNNTTVEDCLIKTMKAYIEQGGSRG